MSASDWEEVKRLAADFQRAQLTSSSQRLSERNCIEIINKLIERNEIEVIFTTDGKEYITPSHLIKEMKDELFVHNGRINLIELAKELSIDLSVISSKAAELAETTPTIHVVNGQFIDQSYVISLCEEVNDKLQQHGQIKIMDVMSTYDLPSDFIQSAIEKYLGIIIKAKQDKKDPHVYFTEDFIDRNKSMVRGALLAISKPVPVSTILSVCNIQENIFESVIDEFKASKTLPGTITEAQGTKSIYTPAIYVKSQLEWVTRFYQQNGYLEFNALKRLGLSDPVSYIKKNFGHSKVIVLSSCAVGPIIFEQVDASIDEIISTGTFMDIMTLLPSIFDEKDAEVILNSVMKEKKSANLHVFNSTYIFTDLYIRNLVKSFDELTDKKARECVSSGEYVKAIAERSGKGDDDRNETKVDRKEERRRKAAEGKGGGGLQGRETKTKSTKKKYMKSSHVDSDDDDYDDRTVKNQKSNQRLELIKLDEITDALNNIEALREETTEELIESLATHLHPILNKNAMEIAKTCYDTMMASSHQDRRKKHNELQEKLNDLILKIRLFEKGYKQFSSKDMQQQLAKYLLKTICTDVANEVFTYVAQDDAKIDGKEMTTELRVKIINNSPNDTKETLSKLHKSLISSTIDDFLNVIDAAVGPGICDIILKKLDKKRESSVLDLLNLPLRGLFQSMTELPVKADPKFFLLDLTFFKPELLNHRQLLIEQMNVSNDPALVLHLAALIVFQGITQTMLHASGKFISSILTFLQPSLPSDTYNTLQVYHDAVLQLLTSSDAEEIKKTEEIVESKMQSIKDIALSFKKSIEKSRLTSE